MTTLPVWTFPNSTLPVGSSNYYSLRFAPAPLREDLAILFGWRAQLEAIPREVSDPGVARRKLHWWQTEIQQIHRGVGTHPIAAPLHQAIQRHDLPLAVLLEPFTRLEAVLDGLPPPGFRSLTELAEADLGALFESICRCHGLVAPHLMIERARQLGAYCTLVEQLRDSGWSIRHGRGHWVPQRILHEAGLDLTGILGPSGRGHLPLLVRHCADRIRTQRAALAVLPELPVSVRIQVRLRDALLDTLEASDFAVAEQRITLTPLRKLWLAWRESRR